MSSKASNSKNSKDKSKKVQKIQGNVQKASSLKDSDVLVNLPAGLKYKVPGKRQRVIIGSIVIGLNLLLVIGVLFYFYSPAFQDFVYNFGKG